MGAVPGSLTERGPYGFQSQGAKTHVGCADWYRSQQVAYVMGNDGPVGDLVRCVLDANRRQLAVTGPAEAGSLVPSAVAAVAIIAHGNAVAVKNGPRVTGSVLSVMLSEYPQSHQSPRFADIQLRREMVGLHEFVAAESPFGGLPAKLFRDGGIVLQKVENANVPQQVILVYFATYLAVSLGPHQLLPRQRHADVTGGVVYVELVVWEHRYLGLNDSFPISIAAENAFDGARFKKGNDARK